jgi:prephenate dehydratase
LNIDHVLVGAKGATARQITRVLSHPIALAQCADYFRAHRGIEAVTVFDTAGAVRMVVEAGDPQAAAIASRRAAAMYGAQILAEHIQDVPENWTRFMLIMARTPDTQSRAGHKAILACGLRHEPGALASALQMIASGGLSVTKIEGRPVRGKPFEYRFVVETIAHDGRAVDAREFSGLAATTEWFRILGIYDPGRHDV